MRETKETFFRNVKIEEKEPNAVYSVFFKKAECAIIQKNVFNTLCTLNPQFNSSLKIIATSPELLNIVTVYRKSSEKKVLDVLHSLGVNIQKTSEGQNIIKLFKIKRLVEITDKELTSTKKLIDEYNRYNKNRNKMKR
jgi:ABC-type phosphate/phosphonate transport system substrate-binding protein